MPILAIIAIILSIIKITIALILLSPTLKEELSQLVDLTSVNNLDSVSYVLLDGVIELFCGLFIILMI